MWFTLSVWFAVRSPFIQAADLDTRITEDNVGHQMLKRMGQCCISDVCLLASLCLTVHCNKFHSIGFYLVKSHDFNPTQARSFVYL